MSGVFQNIDPPTPLTARRVCTPRLWCGGRTHSLGGGSIFRKTPDTALYSTYVSALWVENTNMTDCISSLKTLLNTSKDDKVWCLYRYLVHGIIPLRWREKWWESPHSDEGTYTVLLCICIWEGASDTCRRVPLLVNF
jgi:hypothetical protein